MVLVVVIGATACVEGAASEADARAVVESMGRDTLLKPAGESKVLATRKDPCGGGSVAPFVERDFSNSNLGSAAEVEDLYRQRMVEGGWHDIRDVPAGGIGASKGERTVLVVVSGPGKWNVFMQHGERQALCGES